MTLLQHTSSLENSLPCLNIVADCPGQLIVKILDIQGKWAKTVKETVRDGAEQLYIRVDDLKTGNYVLNIFNEIGFVKSIRYTKS